MALYVSFSPRQRFVSVTHSATRPLYIMLDAMELFETYSSSMTLHNSFQPLKPTRDTNWVILGENSSYTFSQLDSSLVYIYMYMYSKTKYNLTLFRTVLHSPKPQLSLIFVKTEMIEKIIWLCFRYCFFSLDMTILYTSNNHNNYTFSQN